MSICCGSVVPFTAHRVYMQAYSKSTTNNFSGVGRALPVVVRRDWVVVGGSELVAGRRVAGGRVGPSTGVVVVVPPSWRRSSSVTLRCSHARRQLSSVRKRLALPLQPPYVNDRQVLDAASW